ncbi:hypothetical protein Nmel_015463, partial [Mimus melanotis]
MSCRVDSTSIMAIVNINKDGLNIKMTEYLVCLEDISQDYSN